jgi:hypothetical protein
MEALLLPFLDVGAEALLIPDVTKGSELLGWFLIAALFTAGLFEDDIMILKCTQVHFVIGFTTYVYLKPAYFESKIDYRY